MVRPCSGRCRPAMRSGERFRPDWRDWQAYAPLLAAERPLLAWEWLRRDETYRCAAIASNSRGPKAGEFAAAPQRWGLHAFEPPDLVVPRARPVWRLEVHPYVLPVEAAGDSGDDCFDLGRLAPLCSVVSDRSEHLLICDGLRSIRIDILAGSIKEGRVRFRYLIAGFEAAEKPLLTLRRLLALYRTGRISVPVRTSDARMRRHILMLRACDALAAGATQREIAAELLDRDARLDRWRVWAPGLRSRVQRLVRCARVMESGGYRSLLLV